MTNQINTVAESYKYIPDIGIYDARLDSIVFGFPHDGKPQTEESEHDFLEVRLFFSVEFPDEKLGLQKAFFIRDSDDSDLQKALEAWTINLPMANIDQREHLVFNGYPLFGLEEKSCRVLITHKQVVDGIFLDIEAILPTTVHAYKARLTNSLKGIEVIEHPEAILME